MATSYQHQNLVVPEDDPLEAISRKGAQRMLSAALEREVEEYLERQRCVRRLEETEFRGYRNGYGRERRVTIGSGTNKVRAPRVSDTPAEQETVRVKDPEALSKAFAETGGVVFPSYLLKVWRPAISSRRCVSVRQGGRLIAGHHRAAECAVQSRV